jgi:hypothetical protein
VNARCDDASVIIDFTDGFAFSPMGKALRDTNGLTAAARRD